MPPEKPPEKRRIQHTDEQKKRLRQYYNNPAPGGKKPSQGDAVLWAKSQLGIDIDQSTVSRWASDKFLRLDAPLVAHSNLSRSTDRRRARERAFDVLELALYEWVKKMEDKISISGELLRIKASYLFNRLPMYKDVEEPQWSRGWINNWQNIYGVWKRKKHGELASANAINCDEEIESIQEILRQYLTADIYNCDETGLFYRALPDASLSTKEVPGHKVRKERLTAMHTVSAAGERMRIWYISKSENPRCFKHVNLKALNMEYRFNKKAWMNTEVMIAYLKWFDRKMVGR